MKISFFALYFCTNLQIVEIRKIHIDVIHMVEKVLWMEKQLLMQLDLLIVRIVHQYYRLPNVLQGHDFLKFCTKKKDFAGFFHLILVGKFLILGWKFTRNWIRIIITPRPIVCQICIWINHNKHIIRIWINVFIWINYIWRNINTSTNISF